MAITTQDLFIAQMKSEYTTKEQAIVKYIMEHDTLEMSKGRKYYYNEPDILDRKITYYDDNENLVEDETATNNKDCNNFHKVLVDQKVLYLFGKEPTIDFNDDTLEEYFKELIDIEDLTYDLNNLGTAASNKGVEYLHPHINSEGEFDYLIIPAEQGIPIYKTSLQNEMEYFIRYYPIYDNDKKKTRVEFWDKNEVSYYIMDGAVLTPDPTFEDKKHIMPHYEYFDEKVSWESGIPFIEFKNNAKKVSDIKFYKSLVDSYNKNISDLDNELEDTAEQILAISGAANTPANVIRKNINHFKILKVDGQNSGLNGIKNEIAVAAKQLLLDRLERNIFVFGQGIDMTNSDLGQKSGTALQFLYQNLDLKANKMEAEFKRALNKFMKFVVEYINKDKFTKYTNKDITFTFNRTKVADEQVKADVDKTKSETIKNSMNVLDLETLIKKHPLINEQDDVDEIIQRIQAERGRTL